jgi:hypothetical protein
MMRMADFYQRHDRLLQAGVQFFADAHGAAPLVLDTQIMPYPVSINCFQSSVSESVKRYNFFFLYSLCRLV